MNFNDDPKRLRIEEQKVLDSLISRMDEVLQSLDQRMREYVEEAKNADISINPDLYMSRLLAQKGIEDTAENRRKLLQARDELYHTHLLLHYDSDGKQGIDDVKVGLHSCMNGEEQFVISWKMPLCRHYILDNASTEYESIVKDKNGAEYHTNYTLLVKNQVKLRFTHVVKAMNMYPGIFDDKMMKRIKGTGFFSEEYLDEMIHMFNPDDYDPESAAKIISDEFLQELLERRATPEFKNIVFSIQKKQGEIIQAPYKKNMVVQGCAGSGKSMIMLHRLPILLYDNPTSLSRTNLYIITPSQMYIQLAENMRHQLEISDINMGTIEQYYDLCISKYPGHKAGEYGKISYTSKVSAEVENYVYSEKLIDDINDYYRKKLIDTDISLEKAHNTLNLKENDGKEGKTFAQKIGYRLSEIQKILNANNDVLVKYFKAIIDSLASLRGLVSTLRYRKKNLLREITKSITKQEAEIEKAQKELEKLDPEANAVAVKNRNNTIEASQKKITEFKNFEKDVNADIEYFNSLSELGNKIEDDIRLYDNIKSEYIQNTVEDVYIAIAIRDGFISSFKTLLEALLTIEDKYVFYLGAISKEVNKAKESMDSLRTINDRYLDIEYYGSLRQIREVLTNISSEGIKSAYKYVMGKLGIKHNQGSIRAIKSSPYIYLQALYLFYGMPPSSKESLLAIDEAQGIAPEEIRLLKNINGDDVVFNLYGDVFQHIEGTKGIDSWDEYRSIIDYDVYEMQENYRNASQITEYCNRVFDMKMIAINTPGKGVHELKGEEAFRAEINTQLMGEQGGGLSAILVGSDSEARYLMDAFSTHRQKLHDMTDEDFSIHHNRWNIIHIDDAKGLEFSSVIVLSGRMSRNQKYIAYTRALDDLYVYSEIVDVKGFEKKPRKTQEDSLDPNLRDNAKSKDTREGSNSRRRSKHVASETKKSHEDSVVRAFFEEKGLTVIDKRDGGGRLWVLGNAEEIREIVNEAISKFKIIGKYTSGKESNNKAGWCSKTDK